MKVQSNLFRFSNYLPLVAIKLSISEEIACKSLNLVARCSWLNLAKFHETALLNVNFNKY